MSNIWRDRYQRTRFMVQKTIHEYSAKPTLRAYTEILLTLFAISLFGIFAIRPTIKTIGKLTQEIKAKEETLLTMNQKISNLQSAKDLYDREIEKIILVDEAIPVNPQPQLLTLQIEELAKANGVYVNNLSLENTTFYGVQPDPKDQDLAFNLNVTGNYQNLLKFAEEIENLRRPVKFDGFLISTNQKSEMPLSMTLRNLSTPYFLK